MKFKPIWASTSLALTVRRGGCLLTSSEWSISSKRSAANTSSSLKVEDDAVLYNIVKVTSVQGR